MTNIKVKSSLHSPVFSLSNKLVRVLWAIVYNCLFRFSPTPLFKYRSFLLRAFGAKVGKGCAVYPSVEIWLPSNLVLGDRVALGPAVKIYNQGAISIGDEVIISQGAHLCASTHDYNNPVHPLILAPIMIEHSVWICADAFVGPGVLVSEGAVVGARAVVNKAVPEWTVHAGNPASKIKNRVRFSK